MTLAKIASTVLTSVILLAVCALAADKEIKLYDFNKNAGGTNTSGTFPTGKLLLDQAGNLFGVAQSGAQTNSGTIFELTPNGSGGYNFNVIYTCGSTQDCNNSLGSLVMDSAGNLYGSTIFGNVFKLTNGSGGWTASLVFQFTGGVGGIDGRTPSPVILDSAGNLYGVCLDGGINSLGYVFELSPSGGKYSLTHLYDFAGAPNDGALPLAALIMDAAGNLYGTTELGGNSTLCTSGCGVEFELVKHSGTFSESVIHTFTGTNGYSPQGPLFMDAAGNLYGTATGGGAHGFGLVFETSLVSGVWKTRALYSFTDSATDGAFPDTALVMDAAGNLYGTTESGGPSACNLGSDVGCGTAFELSTIGGGKWKELVLHIFTGGGDGSFPRGVILGSGGNLFGVANNGGGLSVLGVAYELSPP
jgi:uncharacterized repeat protein (TIGR03803 family)